MAAKRGLNVVPSFSVLSSGLNLEVAAEELILKGARKKPVGGQTMTTFYNSITHLHFQNKRLLNDVAAITLCANLRVLYVYENRLTTLRGLGALQRLTHLYAQDNEIESLEDFEAPPMLEQLHLTGNRLTLVGGLEQCMNLQELHVGRQKVGAPAPKPPAAAESDLEPLDEGSDGNNSAEGGGDGSSSASAESIALASVSATVAAIARRPLLPAAASFLFFEDPPEEDALAFALFTADATRSTSPAARLRLFDATAAAGGLNGTNRSVTSLSSPAPSDRSRA